MAPVMNQPSPCCTVSILQYTPAQMVGVFLCVPFQDASARRQSDGYQLPSALFRVGVSCPISLPISFPLTLMGNILGWGTSLPRFTYLPTHCTPEISSEPR